MAHLGETLKKHRLSRRVELSDISTQTRISMRYLEALENGEYNELPGAIFARSFARQYARIVGLDEASIEADLQAAFQDEQPAPVIEAQGEPPRFQVSFAPLRDLWESSLEARMPLYAAALAGVIGVCSLVYVSWQQFVIPSEFASQEPRIETPAAPPAVVPPAVNTVAPNRAADGAPVATASQPPTAQPTGQVQVSRKDLGDGTAEFVVSDGVENGMAVRIVASQETWVSVTANGRKLYSGILQPNDVRMFKGVESAQMVIGNAGGVEVSRNGRSIGPIGNPGEVRVVVLRPEEPPVIKKNPPPPADGQQEEPTARTD
ncbi:MAG: DUF4115 domain-containing protein [Bryobacteraceae bacterium]